MTKCIKFAIIGNIDDNYNEALTNTIHIIESISNDIDFCVWMLNININKDIASYINTISNIKRLYIIPTETVNVELINDIPNKYYICNTAKTLKFKLNNTINTITFSTNYSINYNMLSFINSNIESIDSSTLILNGYNKDRLMQYPVFNSGSLYPFNIDDSLDKGIIKCSYGKELDYNVIRSISSIKHIYHIDVLDKEKINEMFILDREKTKYILHGNVNDVNQIVSKINDHKTLINYSINYKLDNIEYTYIPYNILLSEVSQLDKWL